MMLREKATTWRKALSDADCGPLTIASEVVAIADEWATYQSEADGLSCSSWLVKTLGRGKSLSYFTRRYRAVQRIGEHARRTWNHAAAVWASESVVDERHLGALRLAVLKQTKHNGGNPLTLVQVQRLAREIIGVTRRPRTCARCAALEAQLRSLGFEPASHPD